MSHTQPGILDGARPAPTPVISVWPVVLPAPDRGADLQVRVTAPMAGRDLAIFGGYPAHETTDWSLDRVALIQHVSTAYLHSALNLENEAWSQVRAALAKDSHPMGRLESK